MRGRAALLGLLALVLIVSATPLAAADNPPEVVIDTPDHGSTVSGTVVISGRAGDDTNVSLVKVRIDDGEWHAARDTSGDGSWHTWALDWDTTTVPNGWHAIGALAVDGSGQLADARIEVFVENHDGGGNHPPRVAIDEPAHGSTVRGTILVKGRSSDEDVNDAVELVQVRIDHGAWQNATPTGANGSWDHWEFSWNTSTVDDGWHAFSARAFDGELWSDDKIVEYFVDNVHDENRRPFAEIMHPRNGETVRGIVLIHGVAGDPDDRDRVELVQVRIGDGDWMRAVDTSRDHTWRTWAFQWDTTTRDNGEVHICARAFDGDLYSELAYVEVCVDNENDRPWAKIVHPHNEDTVHGLVLIHGTAGDDHGVKLVEVRIDDREWDDADNTGRERPWSTWAYEWNTVQHENGKHRVCARAHDGERYSEPHCIVVIVHNERHDGGGILLWVPESVGSLGPLLALGLFGSLGVAMLMWLRAHGFLR